MIEKNDIINFFNKCAETWDAGMVRNEDVISAILDNAGVKENIDVLDVACGTGVLFNDYLSRGVASVTGVDISPEMAKRARAKYDDLRIKVICEDIEEADASVKYDVVMLYDAFPHFSDSERLIQKLAMLAKTGGRVSIAHGMSREKIDAHHSGSARYISNALISAEQLSSIMSKYLETVIVISDEHMYQVVGIRK